METLNICYAADDNYIDYVCVSIYSLLMHNSDMDIKIFILDNGVSNVKKENMGRFMNKFSADIEWLDVMEFMKSVQKKGGAEYRGYSTYARIYIDRVIPKNVKTLLYIDGDTMVNDSIKFLLSFDFNGKIIAGVKDLIVPEYKKAIHFFNGENYINAGVLLIDRDAWRRNGCERILLKNLSKICLHSKMPDQDLINIALKEYITVLPLRCNVYDMVYSMKRKELLKIYRMKQEEYYTKKEFEEAVNNSAIIHFTCGLLGRPWTDYCMNPMRYLWREYYKEIFKKDVKLLPANILFKNKIVNLCYRKMPRKMFVLTYRLIRILTGKKVVRIYKGMWNNR